MTLRPFSRSLPMSLLRAREAVMRAFRPLLREHGLSEQQWRVLRALSATPRCDVTALVDATCLLGPSLSRILPDLERRKLIKRQADPDDLRRSTVSLTPSGLAVIARVTPHSEAAYARIETRFGSHKLDDLQRLLAELERAID